MERSLIHEDRGFELVLASIRTAFMMRKPYAIERAVGYLKQYQAYVEPPRQKKDKHGNVFNPEIRFPPAIVALMRKRCELIQTILAAHGSKFTPRDDTGPTPETVCKPARRDNIISLTESGRITHDQSRAARELQEIIESMTSCVQARGQKFERTSPGVAAGVFQGDMAYRWSKLYLPWHEQMRRAKDGERRSKVVMSVLVDGVTLDTARRRACMSYERGHEYFVDAMDNFLNLRQQYQRQDYGREPQVVARSGP